MGNQTGRQGGMDQQRQNRQSDRQQQDQQRSPGSGQENESGKQADTGVPEGEKIGEWSDDESSGKTGSSE